MKQIINRVQFIDAFHNMGRGEQFSYDGLTALYNYLTELEEDTGEEMELDVIALCCDFTEYESMDDYNESYGAEYESADDIRERAQVIELENGGLIVSAH